MSKGRKILIVDDDQTILNMYETHLKNEGYIVSIADNGQTGLELAQKERPDIILLDIMLPQMDGFAVLEKLKGSSDAKKIPVVMLTNLRQEEDKKKGEKLGAEAYLVKADLTPAQMGEKIKKYLK